MKIAIITDTHYGGRRCSKTFHDYFQKFYENIFFPFLEENKISVCIHMGDAFDNRKSIDFWALNWAKKNVYDKFKELGIQVYQLVGNHDCYYKNTNEVNSITSLLDYYNNIVPISSPGEYNINGFKAFMVPWICAENLEETKTKILKTKTKISFGHLELNGFNTYPGHVQQHGMDKSIFQKFKYVFSGHYHTKSNDGHIFYLGNPYQLYWNDVNDKRGFHIFDTNTYELEFIENPYTIFEKIYYEDTNPSLFNVEPYVDKIIKVIIRTKTNQVLFEKFIDKIIKAGIIDLKIVENVQIYDEDVDFDTEKIEDTITLLDKYVDDSDFSLDKERVKQLLKEVYIEACELE